jgi:class 3 adenylate cyclase/predicted ATPase
MDVVVWLRSRGLEQYEAAFRENEINERILPSLTQEDLKEIGVRPVGHRRILLQAIAALGGHTGTNAPSAEVAIPSTAPCMSPEDQAERRQVTVLFSDLVGSTALSARMDPEDLRDVISAYRRSVAETVGRFGGFVAKYMGDGVLIYFGYPQAHEDDAERAVRAGLDLIAAVAALNSVVTLQTRVGIATGLVVVGDLIGSGEAQERSIVGETPNLAARLQGVAGPDMVVISETTRRLVGNLFELDDLGAFELKGLSSPVRAWAPLRSRPMTSRFEALRAGRLMPLVGRGSELDLLLRRWERAKSGEGQLLLLSGEPGIGKSRLTTALLERLAGEAHGLLSYACSPQHVDSAYYPVIGLVERAAEFGHGDAVQQRLDKLDAYFADNAVPESDAALFADLLSLRHDGRYPIRDLTPEQQRERTLQALVDQVKMLAQRSSLLIVFEDVHWCDPTTLEFLNRTVTAIASLRVFAIVTCRPEFRSPWAGQSHVASEKLDRLDDQEARTIAAQLVGESALPANVLAAITARADGNPLFVEEITKAVIEAENEGTSRHAGPSDSPQAPSVPASLQASLMARLDRLGPEAKEIAQISAAIGREFSQFLLAAVASRNEGELRQSLDRLIEAGLVFRQGSPSQANYVFKHALLRDAAYGTLLRGARRALHLRIARALEGQWPDIVQASPESLAHHYTEAGAIERAATLWGMAGRRSRTRSALAEAEVQLSRALGQIGTLLPTPSLRREQIALQVELLTVLMHTKGYGAEQTKAAAERARLLIERAEAIGEPPEDSLLLFSVIYGFWVVNIAGFNGDAARELADQFMQLATKQAQSGPLLLAHRMMGATLMSVGIPTTGREHLDQAIALYDAVEHRALATRFGTDAQVAILEWRSRTHWLLGFPLAARSDANRSFICAREIDQAATLMHALAHSTATLILLGDVAEAGARATELVALAEEKGSSYWSANGLMWQGCLMAQTGRASEAVRTLASSIETYHSTGATIYIPFVMSYLARAHCRLGQHKEALDVIDRAIAMAQNTKEQWCDAELYRTKGDLVLMSQGADVAAAEAHFERALGIARQQHAKSWELRAATSMARLWRDQDKGDAARDLLAPVYDWFTEGFDTVDLKEAKVLLDAFAP